MRRFAGCCRFTWNKALALEKETYEQGGKRHGNAALNILAAGHAVTVGGVGKAQAPTMKQKPAYGAAR